MMPERSEPDQIYRPADELAQREEIGGTDDIGRELPQTPVLVQPVGIALVRPAAPLARADGAQTADAGTVVRVSGPTPQRRRLLVSATQDVRVAGVEASLSTTTGFLLPVGSVLDVQDTGPVHAYVTVNGTTVSWWHEMDVG